MENNVLISSYMSCSGGEDDAAESQSYVDTLSLRIKEGSLTLVNLVTLLGEYLTRDNDIVRTRATNCLVDVLNELPKFQLNKRQVAVITKFFSDRLEDEPCVAEVLRGLQIVIEMTGFSDPELTTVVLTALKDHVNMRRIVQQVRFTVFSILEKLLTTNLFQDTESLFVDSFLTLSSGEKDPRNLLLSFKISSQVLKQFPPSTVQKEEERLFDNIFCYFPITFQQPKNDPYGITPDRLKEALEGCLASNGILAAQVFPALIEKLTAVSQQVKIDALNAMCVCLEKYSPDAIASSSIWETIWNGLKFEVLHGSEEVDTAVLASTVLRQLAIALSSPTVDASPLESYLDAIQSETKSKLDQTPVKSSLPAAMLVAGISYATVDIFDRLCSFGVENCLRHLDTTVPAETQKWGLEVLLRYLTAYRNLRKDYPSTTAEFPQSERVFQVLLKSLAGVAKSEHQVRTLALNGLVFLCELNIVDKNELEFIVQYFDEILLSRDTDDEPLRGKALECLLKLIQFKKEEAIIGVTYPALLAELNVDSDQSAKYILSALSALATTRPLFEPLSIRLFSKLDDLAKTQAPETASFMGYYIIDGMLKAAGELELVDLSFMCPKLIDSLVSRVVALPILHTEATCDSAGKLLNLLMISLHQTQDSAKITEALSIIDSHLRVFLSKNDSNLIALYEMGIARIDDASLLDAKELFTQSLTQLSKQNVSSYIRGAFCRLLALASNKWIDDSDWLTANIEQVWNSNTVELLEAVCWCTKGLLLKADKLGFKLASQIVSRAVSSEKLGGQAAILSAILVLPDTVLNVDNGVKIRKLYMQRLIAENLPKLVEGLKATSRVNSIVTLSGILRYAPSKIIVPEIPKILPLLLESFEIKNSTVQEAAINTVLVTLSDATETFSPHVNALVPRLLRLAQYEKNGPSAAVRCAAISCLSSLATSVPRTTIERFRADILQRLAKIVDDPKREVRKQAVICGQVYHELR